MRAPRDRPPTIHDVAAEAGVSKSLVSLAVRGDAGVRAETRARILDAADRLGYRSNPWARSLARGRSQTVGVLLDDLRSGYHTDVVHGVEDAAEANGMSVVIADGRRDRDVLRTRLERMLALGLDGVVIVSGQADADAIGDFARRVPLVVVGRPVGLPPGVGQVSNDDRTGMRLAVHHLVALGHRRIAHLSGSARPAAVARRDSYRTAMHELGLESHAVVESDAVSLIARVADGAAGAPTAVCCANDRLAVDLIGRAFDAGVPVPRSLSVAGYDDIDLASTLRPTLTSVDQPRRDMGALALKQLTDMLAGHPARHEVATPTLVVRESTAELG
ncbi:LacI family DNA-binding transcriptional regulator [uncultured Microbacterium sp.]|uniref:LacI family DNA-binding transcriptional regulator n=1 Tax=uncultured Microbacterium sp. TaxID=191216 RepID=UPI00261AA015|nr:LacI family DNA-binding transcriptional regulator [uncultured Microbacterium sp.]